MMHYLVAAKIETSIHLKGWSCDAFWNCVVVKSNTVAKTHFAPWLLGATTSVWFLDQIPLNHLRQTPEQSASGFPQQCLVSLEYFWLCSLTSTSKKKRTSCTWLWLPSLQVFISADIHHPGCWNGSLYSSTVRNGKTVNYWLFWLYTHTQFKRMSKQLSSFPLPFKDFH